MKKLVAFALVLSLGLFLAVGCAKEVKPVTPPANRPPANASATPEKKAGEAAKPGEPAKPETKPEEKPK